MQGCHCIQALSLTGKDNPSALAASNARLRQTDLVSELLGTLAFGWGSAHLGMSTSLAVLTALTFLFLPLELYYLQRVRGQLPSAPLNIWRIADCIRILGPDEHDLVPEVTSLDASVQSGHTWRMQFPHKHRGTISTAMARVCSSIVTW